MYFLNNKFNIKNFKLLDNNTLKKLIKIKSYLRNGKIVKQSVRNIKKVNNSVLKKESNLLLNNSKNIIKKEIKNKEEKVILNYFNTEYNNRLNLLQKEEIMNWDKKLNNINPKKLNNITDWDDSVSVLSFIQEDIKKNPSSFRSVSKDGKIMSMATVEEDKINKCLKIKNLLSNPERLTELNMKPYGAGITSIIHMIEESNSLGYEGKLKLTALPKASKFYEKLGFKRIGSEYQFQYVLEKDKAQELLDNHFNNIFNTKLRLNEFSINEYKEAINLEQNIIAFAISNLKL